MSGRKQLKINISLLIIIFAISCGILIAVIRPVPSSSDTEGPAPASSSERADSWPMFRGGPGLIGVAAGKLPNSLELRWKFIHFLFLKQNVYLALAGFLDGGLVTSEYKIDISGVPAEWMYLFPGRKESLHLGTGAGFHIALNQNFIITADYGLPLNEQDGPGGALYINLNFLF